MRFTKKNARMALPPMLMLAGVAILFSLPAIDTTGPLLPQVLTLYGVILGVATVVAGIGLSIFGAVRAIAGWYSRLPEA